LVIAGTQGQVALSPYHGLLLNVEKILITKKETQVLAEEMRGVGTEMALKIHEKKRNSANKLFLQSVLESCRIEFENCKITWKRSA